MVWAPEATGSVERDRQRPVLTKAMLSGSLNAQHIPGVTKHPKNAKQEQAAAADNLANGLCA